MNADDRTRVADALRAARAGEPIVYRGDYRNAVQLLRAMKRKLPRGAMPHSLAQAFRRVREEKALEAALLGRLVVPLSNDYRIELAHAPDVAEACRAADLRPGLAALREILGAVGADQWRRKGVWIGTLGGRVHPSWGVFAPVRGEYVDLVAAMPAPGGKRCLDVGTGTGVLALVLARRGAREVVATDVDPRACACARENAGRHRAAVRVVEADLWPPGEAPFDLIVANPPWVPAAPQTAIDRAVYDEGGRLLARLVSDLPSRLAPGGEAWLVLSDLAERLGLRAPGELERMFSAAGIEPADRRSTRPRHPRSRDASDALYAARAAEQTHLWVLRPRGS